MWIAGLILWDEKGGGRRLGRLIHLLLDLEEKRDCARNMLIGKNTLADVVLDLVRVFFFFFFFFFFFCRFCCRLVCPFVTSESSPK